MVNKPILISNEIANITDAQLQKRLKDEFNFACGPITDTTKSIYIKKLQELIDKSTSSPARSTTPVKTATPTSTPKATRRKTIVSPVIENVKTEIKIDSPKVTRRASVGRSSPKSKAKKTAAASKKESNKSSATIATFSDTETEDLILNDKPSSSINTAALEYSRGNRLLRKSFNNRISSTRSATAKEDQIASNNSSGDEKSGGVFYSTKLISSTLPTPTATTTRSFRLFNKSNSLSNFSDSENEETNNLINDNKKKEATSFTENITKRLLRHRVTRSNAAAATTTNKDYSTSKYLNNQAQVVSQAIPNEANQLADTYSTQWNWISYSILIAGILFFAFIFSFYFYSRYFSVASTEEAELNALEKEFDFSIHDLNIPGCLKQNSNATDADGICSTNHIRPVLLVIKEMKKIVDKKLTSHYCSSDEKLKDSNPYEYSIQSLKSQLEMSIGKSVTDLELESRQQRTKAVNRADLFLSVFVNALDLLENNSKWFMKPIRENGKYEKIIIDSNYPKTLHPTCQVKLFMIKTFWYFVTLTTISVIGFLIYIYVNSLKSQALKEKELLFELVEKSIELLQSPDEPQSLPILHIRDMLLNPQQRKLQFYQKIWEQVVHFIENNESRIKSSLENIDGEDYKTWKWVAASNQPDSTVMKVSQIDWQNNIFSDDNTSPALITQSTSNENAVSRSINTSTPIKNNTTTSTISSSQMKDFVALTRFLKVRNLVDQETRDTDDDWKSILRNQVMRRCCKQSSDGKTHGIQHIHIEDRNVNDSLVYVKCDSIETASNAFKALHGVHGFRVDKEVVSVKFLKEDRYYNRFPEASQSKKVLKN